MNLLLIENHTALREMMTSVLSESGHSVTARGEEKSGQAAYLAGDFPVVLVDLGLADKGGHEFIRWVRDTPAGTTTVVLALTEQANPHEMGDAVESGADDFISKPIAIDQLKLRVTMAERQAELHRIRHQAQQDITSGERRYRELYAQAKRQAQEYSLIDRVRTAITRGLEPEYVFESVIDGITSTFGYTYVALILREGDRLIVKNHAGYSSLPAEFLVNQGIVGRVVRTGEPSLVRNIAEDPDYIGTQIGIVSEMCVPLKDAGRVVGAINVETTGEQKLTERDLSLLSAVGDQVGLAIARSRLYAELRGNEERFRALVQHASDIILVLDAKGTVQSASPSVSRVLGYEPLSLVGRSNAELVFPDDRPILLRSFRSVLKKPQQPHRSEMRFRHRDGSFRWLEVVASNLLNNPHVAGIVVNARDATERKLTQEELTQALAAQQTANKELQRMNRLKTDFVSVVSHEFRTPLTSICGFSELLATDEMDVDQVREFASLINSEALRLDRLIGDILDLNRMESGRFSLLRTPVDLGKLITDVVDRTRRTSPLHRFETTLEGDLTAVWADRDKLTQVMTNLLSNAVKYSPSGGTISVQSTIAHGLAYVRVRDQGIGIPAENLESIFDRYTRVDEGVSRQIAGTGLGLAIVRQIVEMHGGKVWAESTPNVGSTFHLQLPTDRRNAESGMLSPRATEYLLSTGSLVS